MKRPLRVYIETTMFSFKYETRTDGDYPRYRAEAETFFERVRAGRFVPFSSAYTADELRNEPDEEKRVKMLNLIPQYNITMLDTESPEIDRLAGLYIADKAIPAAFFTDARHIAITTYYQLDFIVSLNFKHISRDWTITRVGGRNVFEGYKPIGIFKPEEVLK